jgi:uncharacterized protein (DUF305 family)
MSLFDTRRTAAALLAAAALCGAAEARAQATHHGHSHGHAAPARTPGDSTRWTAADVRFMQQMIPHHAQALEMARLAESNGASGPVRILAGRILNAQEDEIATMQRWLRARGQTVPEASSAGHEGMHGMLTAAQMRELKEARGADFDQLFLTYMIQHHRGAVSMVTELFSHDGAGQDDSVFKFASDVNVDQTTEIARMQRMLANVLFPVAAP